MWATPGSRAKASTSGSVKSETTPGLGCGFSMTKHTPALRAWVASSIDLSVDKVPSRVSSVSMGA
eukprot:7850055-Lingulodinium_polyedra.AAC.1